eukprot:RCo019951
MSVGIVTPWTPRFTSPEQSRSEKSILCMGGVKLTLFFRKSKAPAAEVVDPLRRTVRNCVRGFAWCVCAVALSPGEAVRERNREITSIDQISLAFLTPIRLSYTVSLVLLFGDGSQAKCDAPFFPVQERLCVCVFALPLLRE